MPDGLRYKMVFFSVVFLVSMILGTMVAILPVKFLFSFLIILVFIIVVFLNPWVSVVITLGLVSGLDLPGFFPQLGFLGGKVVLSDLFLLLSVLFVFIYFRSDFKLNIKALKPIQVFFVIYFFLVFISCLIAYFFFESSVKNILGEFRHQLYWLLLPVFAILSVDNERYKKIIISLLILGFIASILQLLQGVGGIKLSGQVRELTTMGIASEVVRTNIAIFLIAWSFFFSTAALLLGFLPFVKFIIPFFLNVLGLVVTYTKSFWAGIFIGFILLLAKFEFKLQVASIFKLATLGLLTIIIVFLIKPQLLDSVVDRISAISEEVDSGYSLHWRLLENELAMDSIVNYPYGIGLGSAYRAPTVVDDNVADMVRYIHNSYLYLLVKLGFLGLLMLLVIFYKTIRISIGCNRANTCIRTAKSRHDKFDVLVFITFTPILVGMLVYAVFTPVFMVDSGIAFLATMMGILLGRALNFKSSKA